MTLHWWMHWFWITSLAISVCVCSPTLPTIETPDLQSPSPSIRDSDVSASKGGFNFIPIATTSPLPVRGHRGGKAIGQPPPNPSTVRPYFKVSIAFPLATGSDTGDEGSPLQKELALNLDYKIPPLPTAEIEAASNMTLPKIEEKNITEPTVPTETETEASINLEVMTNSTVADVTVPNSVANSSNVTLIGYNNTVNDSVVKVIEDVTEEPAKNNTTGVEISTARALLLETGVGRRAAESDVSKSQVAQDTGGLDAGAVSGICFGILVVLGLGGAISLVLYRRRYLNKPQTLNDKCSNPDSSGYIDDSTIRENSEEMYSLDNDSFLNSLEAMTIQNYWTDSVKHTKL